MGDLASSGSRGATIMMTTRVKAAIKAGLSALGLMDPARRLKAKANDYVLDRQNARIRRKGADDGLPIPPPELLYFVADSYDVRWFLHGGKLATECIREVLGRNEISMESFEKILDFGCGCGRVIRHWRDLKGIEISGTDCNPEIVEWCRRNLPLAKYSCNDLTPPTSYDDNQFDLVYAFSVFTHLSEEIQRQWIAEFARIIKPGRYLLLSLAGESFMYELTLGEREQFEAGRVVVKGSDVPGTNQCTAYHPEQYVRGKLVDAFEILEFIGAGAKGNPPQDLYLLRKPVSRSDERTS